MTAWLYKWLPIFCGCHCRDDRSFHWRGKRFPVCARCTGELAGMVLGIVPLFFYRPPLWAVGVLMIPMVADGFLQLLTKYESTNPRRFVTGLLFGYALLAFIVVTAILAFQFGYNLNK